MKQYYRTTVTGTGKNGTTREEVLFLEGQDPVVMAFRRNNALAGMDCITVAAPVEAFRAGTISTGRAPTARELKKRAREEAYRESINERFLKYAPRKREEFDRFRPQFGPGGGLKENG